MCTRNSACKPEPDIKNSALELIGNTPLLALDRIWPGPGRLLAKCEFMNPSASVKDRAAYYMIEKAKEAGKIKPGTPIVDVTSGNHGSALGLICSVLGYPATIGMSKGNSRARAKMMRAYGVNLIQTEQVDGKPGNVTLSDLLAAEEAVMKEKEKIGGYYVDQFNDPNNCLAHEKTTGPEIWRQTGHRVDAFVTVVGTSATLTGTSRFLKKVNPNCLCIAVEPEGSEVIAKKQVVKAKHMLQGAGYGRIEPLFDYNVVQESIAVSDEEAIAYRKLLGEKEGLYLGYTSAANVAAAVKLFKSGRLAEDAWVVTILCDSGLKYPE